jgi:hypothetical protein
MRLCAHCLALGLPCKRHGVHIRFLQKHLAMRVSTLHCNSALPARQIRIAISVDHDARIDLVVTLII